MEQKKLKVLILEGHRLTGKSTIARYLRNKVNYSTLMNLTGFPDKGEEGLRKIVAYYTNWLDFLRGFKDEEVILIFDRHMFSEVVYSREYKDYDFMPYFDMLLNLMVEVADIQVVFFELTNEEELRQRMTRDKVPFAQVPDDLKQLEIQRKGYERLRNEMKIKEIKGMPIKVHTVKVNGRQSKDIADELIANLL